MSVKVRWEVRVREGFGGKSMGHKIIDATHKDVYKRQLSDIAEIERVGYKSVLSKGHYGVHKIDESVMQGMRDFLALAPVHNLSLIHI